jgi:hypothetical protein
MMCCESLPQTLSSTATATSTSPAPAEPAGPFPSLPLLWLGPWACYLAALGVTAAVVGRVENTALAVLAGALAVVWGTARVMIAVRLKEIGFTVVFSVFELMPAATLAWLWLLWRVTVDVSR